MNKQWLFSKKLDLLFLYLPIFLTWGLCFAFDSTFADMQIPLLVWVFFVLGVDVSHVWSTIFRTYLSKDERNQYSSIIKWAPLMAFFFTFIFSWYSEDLFWRVLAYFALYHFIKQQYGFLKLYQLKSSVRGVRLKDEAMIYIGTLYPVFVWHFLGDRKFNWFNTGDFITFPILSEEYVTVFNFLYFGILIAWILELFFSSRRKKTLFPIGKVLWVTFTFGTWWLGIVYFNSDFSFTITNVVAHGIPYMFLVFYYVEEKKVIQKNDNQSFKKITISVLWMLLICLFLGSSEELFWDVFINNERVDLFGDWQEFYVDHHFYRALIIALLSLPQITHYILDGFIWKGKDNPYIKNIFTR
ncbi:hypothetical protein [Flammeovirga sp. EKP202]|uniref:hypothetical protein n=1 Tax=Flammeovirga sp. EKP202 TaxID=2770592 RepID=UPI00165F34F9|nr:hypothetical protein [Flammeovirga sp. EKP202]MBD0400969.1 hypothetical protein [Flammeovirga sp. EKP202]